MRSLVFGVVLCWLVSILLLSGCQTETHSIEKDPSTTEIADCRDDKDDDVDYQNAPVKSVNSEDLSLIFEAIAPLRSAPSGWTSKLSCADLSFFDKLPLIHDLLVAELDMDETALEGKKYVACLSALVASGTGDPMLRLLAGLPVEVRPDYVLFIFDCRASRKGLFVSMGVGHVPYRYDRVGSISIKLVRLWLRVERLGTEAKATFVAVSND